MSGPAPDPNATIICRVTTWYFRRMGLLAAMLAGMGLYFLYDGRIGYPRDNKMAAEKEWYDREVIGDPKSPADQSYEAARKVGDDFTAEWLKMARERGWIINPDLKEPRWADYAAARGWPEEPKFHSPDKIHEQYYFGGAMLLAAAVAGLLVLKNRNKVLLGYPDHMVMPDGVTVRYDQATCVDKRKWEHKGLAYVHYRAAEGAATRRATIDDLMYGGAEKVLKRLLSQFTGELIEKVPEQEPSHEGAANPQGTGDHPAPKS
jgi:hypothetical protein